jgi:hypothetical protein
MAVISDESESRYWIVTGSDALEDGTFNVNVKQVADFQGNPVPVPPALRRTLNRPNDVPRNTIIKVDERTVVTRTLTVNPTS